MVLVKILGFIDVMASIVFLSIIFSINVPLQLCLFFGGLLFLKGLFVLKGDLFSIFDVFAAMLFILNIFFHPAIILMWIFSLFLMSKGVASFL